MPTQLKYMKGEEFVKKILAGERDFSGIRLEEGFDLSGCEGFGEMQKYLQKERLQKSPIFLENSEFKYLVAHGLYLPFVRGREANFYEANLMEANLLEGDLERADLDGADLERANLFRANLWRANLYGANLYGTNLARANLKNVKNLERVLNLEKANFYETRVTKKEKMIISKALKRRELFCYR